ncbi:MAG: hypothetical protein RLZZ366_1128, partial [Pseudomonadota bacterium]
SQKARRTKLLVHFADSLGDSLENTGLKTGLNDFLGRF